MSTLQSELGELTSSQAAMDRMRSAEKAAFDKDKADLEAGINGVQQAMALLRDYYSKQDDSQGTSGRTGDALISILEVVESDFTKGLSEMQVAESTAVREYERNTEMNKFSKASKEKDVEYKTKEAAGLDKSVAETGSDKDGVQAELDALREYLTRLGKMCIAKAGPYAERARRRNAEIAGLKEALQIIEGEAALLQRSSKRSFRGKH